LAWWCALPFPHPFSLPLSTGVHALERWRSLQAEKRGEDGCGPWEWQGSFLYHLELATDLLLHSLTMAHYAHLWFVHGELPRTCSAATADGAAAAARCRTRLCLHVLAAAWRVALSWLG
jgi:hypothetical protein